MKQISKIIVVLLAEIFLLNSCHIQRFNVYGTPGTIIKTLDGTETLAVIDNNGVANIKLDRRSGYDPFLQAVAPGSDKSVPFALDYKDVKRTELLNLGGLIIALPTFFLGWLYLMACYGDYKYLQAQSTNNDLVK